MFTGVYIILHISAQKYRLLVLVRTASWSGSNEYPQSMFWAEMCKISELLIWKLSGFGGEISKYLNRRVCVETNQTRKRSCLKTTKTNNKTTNKTIEMPRRQQLQGCTKSKQHQNYPLTTVSSEKYRCFKSNVLVQIFTIGTNVVKKNGRLASR